jgi:hypothetical protein
MSVVASTFFIRLGNKGFITLALLAELPGLLSLAPAKLDELEPLLPISSFTLRALIGEVTELDGEDPGEAGEADEIGGIGLSITLGGIADEGFDMVIFRGEMGGSVGNLLGFDMANAGRNPAVSLLGIDILLKPSKLGGLGTSGTVGS